MRRFLNLEKKVHLLPVTVKQAWATDGGINVIICKSCR